MVTAPVSDIVEITPDDSTKYIGRKTILVFAGCVLLAHAPLVVLHFHNLVRYQPHYEFFPLVLIAVVWLLWRRRPTTVVQQTYLSRWLARSLLLLGLGLLAVSVVLFSPWVAAIAAVVSTGGLLLLMFGRNAVRDLAPAWLLLWLLIPPPFRWDDLLIRHLQRVTGRLVSGIMELGGLRHVLSGNVFQLPNRELFVAEACSGIHSQLVLIAGCLTYAVFKRYRVFRVVLLVLTGIFWSLVANTTRVAIVTVAAARFDVDLTSGWIHEALGYSLMLGGFLMLVLTDRILGVLLAPVCDFRQWEMTGDGAPQDFLSRSWNRWIADGELPTPGGTDVVNAADPDHPPDSPRSPLVLGPFAPKRAVAICGVAFLSLGLLQVVLIAGHRESEIQPVRFSSSIHKNWLPAEAIGWRVKDYSSVQRERGSDDGMCSCIWQYASGDRTVYISVDFPFLGWHDLTRCYSARGWRLEKRTFRDSTVEVELARPSGERGFLLYSLFDAAGRPLQPRSSHWKGWRAKLATSPLVQLFGGVAAKGDSSGAATVAPSGTTMQVQQFVASEYPLGIAEQESLRNLFVNLRDHIQENWRATASAAGS